MKLAIGTAQFGFNYGLNKKKIKISEIKNIEKVLKKNSLKYFDTAINYGVSEKILGSLKIEKKIITKIKLPNNKPKNLKHWFEKKIKQSLKKLEVKTLYGLLIHDVTDILGKKNEFLGIILEAKKKKLISKVGISVYDTKEVDKILKTWKPDIIQFPSNIFDQRFLNIKLLKQLKKFNVEIYVRSCFLQGILLGKTLKRGGPKSQKLFLNFLSWCSFNKINQVTACLHFIKKYEYIDYLIVGFDNTSHLKEIINSFNKELIFVPNIFNNNEQKLIDPRKWSAN